MLTGLNDVDVQKMVLPAELAAGYSDKGEIHADLISRCIELADRYSMHGVNLSTGEKQLLGVMASVFNDPRAYHRLRQIMDMRKSTMQEPAVTFYMETLEQVSKGDLRGCPFTLANILFEASYQGTPIAPPTYALQ